MSFEQPAGNVPPLADRAPAVWESLVVQLRQAVQDAGYTDAVIGLSGGIDSALVAALAVDAFGADCVHGVLMPSPYSSKGSVIDATTLAVGLDIQTHTVPITPVFESMREALVPSFAGRDDDVTEENLQARIRGTLLMAFSNKFGWFVLATGNKSEALMGYATLHGDMVGGYAPIAPLYKVHVNELCRWKNAVSGTEVIPRAIIDKAPSAELSHGQLDCHALPPYEILDAILYHYVDRGLCRDDIVGVGFSPSTVDEVISGVNKSAFKLSFAAPGAVLEPLK